MTRQVLNRGTIANDGTGDSLRQMAQKVNENFVELYKKVGGDSNSLSGLIDFDSDGILFVGNTNTTKLTKTDPSSDITIYLPDSAGTLVGDSATQTLSNKTLTTPYLTTPRMWDDSGNNYYNFVPGNLDSDHNINFPSLTDSDEITFNNVTQTLTNKTLTSPSISNPTVVGNFLDSAGNEFLGFTSVASSVNRVQLTNAASGNGPIISPEGSDSDIDLRLQSKNGGALRFEDRVRHIHEFITADGAIGLDVPLTIFNSGSALNMSLPDGTDIGETKYLVNRNSGTATITPTTLLNGTTITVAVDNGCTLMWVGTGWMIEANNGAVLA